MRDMEELAKNENLAEQFNAGHNEYALFIESDPIRHFLHYPSVLKELGELSGTRVLDIGCGDGLFDRKLAGEYGAKVVGYDISSNLIAKAQEKEKEKPLGIHYVKADPLGFRSAESFDNAVAVMVLPYSPDAEYIKNFFASAHTNLKAGGRFISVVFNPEFNGFGQVIANRFFRKAGEQKVDFDFLDPKNGEVKFNAKLAQFSKADYERSAKESGFPSLEWKNLIPNEEGVKKSGEAFWQKAVELQPYALLVARK